jgi:5'-methylthioadenosine phosphorylase
MSKLALLGGRYLLGLPIARGGEQVEVEVHGTRVEALDFGSYVLLSRHGFRDGYVPPNEIDHPSNLRALRELGCSRVLAIGSVGSLREELAVGSLVCPSDFIAFGGNPTTFGDERAHIVAEFDESWRRHVRRTWKEWGSADLRNGGVYWQSAGPRLETRAEIRLIAQAADIVGMTLASECAVACELHMLYASVCVVDNLANGIAAKRLTIERLEAGRVANEELLGSELSAVVPALADEVSREVEVPVSAHAVPHFHRERSDAPSVG